MREVITTGFNELDNLLTGFHGGDLIVVGGRPAMGKTHFALDIVNHLAIGKNVTLQKLLLPRTAIAKPEQWSWDFQKEDFMSNHGAVMARNYKWGIESLKGINDKLMSRFKQGVSISIPEPDYETRRSILKQKAQRDDIMYIPDEILTYIADNITDNVRVLEGALNKLAVYFKILNKRVTLENAKECLADLINEENCSKY